MADSDDDNNDAPRGHTRMSLRTILGPVLDAEELQGIEDDDDAMQELLADMVDTLNLSDGEDDAIEPEVDQLPLPPPPPLPLSSSSSRAADGISGAATADAAAAATTSTSAGPTASYVQVAVERQTNLARLRKRYGFAASVRLDIVDASEPLNDYAWLTDPRGRDPTSERTIVHDAIRRVVVADSSEDPPPMGDGNAFDVPQSIADVRLPRWACVAPLLRTSNTVSTVHTNCQPNQEQLAMNHGSTTYNPNSFAAVKIKRVATALYFRSGRMVVAGARGQRASLLASLQFITRLQRMDATYFDPTCRLQNIVCNATCFPIDLDMLAERYPVHARYDVLRFPGLVFRFGHSKSWVFIIFPPGTIIGTGFVDWTEANLAFRWLYSHVLVQFKNSNLYARETAAEKKNLAFNGSSVFATTINALTAVSLKRTLDDMLREDAAAHGLPQFDADRAWRDLRDAWNTALD